MEKTFEELKSVLDGELEIHTLLVNTAEAFNKAIRENDLEAMQRHTAFHDEKIIMIEKLEEKRIACCKEISQSVGIFSQQLKLASIIEKAPNQMRESLSRVQTALKEKLNYLSNINISNRILLEEALGMIDATFSMFRQSTKKLSPYGVGGKTTASSGHILINRIA